MIHFLVQLGLKKDGGNMFIKSFLLLAFFFLGLIAQASDYSEMPQSAVDQQGIPENHQSVETLDANQEHPGDVAYSGPASEEGMDQPEPDMYHEEPPPEDYQEEYAQQPTTPFRVPKIIKVQKKTVIARAQQIPQTQKRQLANAPARKKIVGMRSVKSSCSMRAMASYTSRELGKTKARSRLWVEEINQYWFKIYRRAGAAFINVNCLK